MPLPVLILIVLLAGGGVFWIIQGLVGSHKKVAEGYKKLKWGMTEAEIFDLLGKPSEQSTVWDDYVSAWRPVPFKDSDVTITIRIHGGPPSRSKGFLIFTLIGWDATLQVKNVPFGTKKEAWLYGPFSNEAGTAQSIFYEVWFEDFMLVRAQEIKVEAVRILDPNKGVPAKVTVTRVFDF